MKTTKRYFLRLLALTMVLILLTLAISGCSSKAFEGDYEHLASTRTYTFECDEKDSGTFEMYDHGKVVGDSGKRYTRTWTLQGDVLTMTSNGEVYAYYKVYEDCLIEIDDVDEEPDMHDYIAPKGKTFDWKYGVYTFHKDGTVEEYSMYSYGNRVGDYYVEDNIIYAKLRYTSPNVYAPESQYVPLFYIYNGEYIAYAGDVFLKK